MRAVFAKKGVALEDAAICADVLLAADLRGFDTHGLSRLAYYCTRLDSGVTVPRVRLEIVKETATTAVVDAHHSIGHAVGHHAMEMAIAKARKAGLGSVAVRNSTHFGIAGYFAGMAAEAGMIGLCTTNARPCVVPANGLEPRYGTNPLAFAAPSDEPFPFLFDASLATVQRGKLEVAERLGKPMPEGYVIDDQGNPVTDAGEALRMFAKGTAALLPLGGLGEATGGHKGYGVSIMLEILSSALQGGAFLSGLSGGDKEGTWKPYCIGHFFLAMSVEAFTEVALFRKWTGDIARELRATRPAPGCDAVLTPGEKDWRTEQERKKTGIPVPPELALEALGLCRSCGLPEYEPLFIV